MIRLFLFLGVSVFLLAIPVSCVSQSPGSRMGAAGVPGNWAASKEAQAGVDRYWIRKIGGSELRQLVRQAISHNPDLKAASARLDRAGAEAKIAGADRLPSLELGGSTIRSKQNFIGFPFGGGASSEIFNQFGVNLNTAWELDVWGRAKAGQEASIANAEARAYEYDAAKISLAGQVTKSWLALGESNQQVKLAKQAVAATVDLAKAVQQRFERAIIEDGGSAAQVRLTQSEVQTRKAALAEREQERERVLRQLEILLGKYPSGKLATHARLPTFPGKTPSGLPSELLQRRPDILAAERELASAGRRLKQAKLARFPSLSLTGSGGTTSNSVSDILSSDFGIWSIGGSLTQPIFQGGRISGNIQSSKAGEREKIALLQKIVLGAFGEVEQSLTAELYLAKRERAAKRAAELAKEAAQRASDEFAAGTGSVMTSIDATKQQIDTASRHTAIRRLRLDNRVNLHLALGGDFQARK